MSIRDDMMESITPAGKQYSRYEIDGVGIPSVTEILSFIDSQGLINWANAIGRKGQNNKDILARAAKYGTETHGAIENYLKNTSEKGTGMELDNSSFVAFKNWWEGLNSCHEVVVLGQEESMKTPLFAGTYDMLMSVDGKVYLVDFKTSNHVGYKYFMQLAAYRHLLYTQKNINIDGCIILQLSKGPRPRFTEYLLDFNIPEHYLFIEDCMNSFVGALYTWHNVERVKKQFDKIF